MMRLAERFKCWVERTVPWYDPEAARRRHLRTLVAVNRAEREIAPMRHVVMRGSFRRADGRLHR